MVSSFSARFLFGFPYIFQKLWTVLLSMRHPLDVVRVGAWNSLLHHNTQLYCSLQWQLVWIQPRPMKHLDTPAWENVSKMSSALVGCNFSNVDILQTFALCQCNRMTLLNNLSGTGVWSLYLYHLDLNMSTQSNSNQIKTGYIFLVATALKHHKY